MLFMLAVVVLVVSRRWVGESLGKRGVGDGKDVRRKEKTTLSFLFAEGEEKKVKVQNLK